MLPGQSSCARSQQVRSIAALRSIMNDCARAHSISQYSHGAAMKRWYGDLGCTWSALARGLLGTSADALERITLGSITAFALKRSNRDQIFLLVNSTL
jgi:hypothetical protein